MKACGTSYIVASNFVRLSPFVITKAPFTSRRNCFLFTEFLFYLAYSLIRKRDGIGKPLSISFYVLITESKKDKAFLLPFVF